MLTFDEANPMTYELLKRFAHENRVNMTAAEMALWNELRSSGLGHKFLRQYIIGDYIVDFVCREEGLVIEVDGAYHSEPRQMQDDILRERWLESRGYHVMRFSNEQILFEMDSVLNDIFSYFD